MKYSCSIHSHVSNGYSSRPVVTHNLQCPQHLDFPTFHSFASVNIPAIFALQLYAGRLIIQDAARTGDMAYRGSFGHRVLTLCFPLSAGDACDRACMLLRLYASAYNSGSISFHTLADHLEFVDRGP